MNLYDILEVIPREQEIRIFDKNDKIIFDDSREFFDDIEDDKCEEMYESDIKDLQAGIKNNYCGFMSITIDYEEEE